MCVAELPPSVSKFNESGKHPALFNSLSVAIHLDLSPGSRHDCKVGGDRIHPQILTPFQFDMPDPSSELLRANLRCVAIGERQLSVHGHEKRRAVLEVLEPGKGTILRHIKGYLCHELPHVSFRRRRFG